MPGPTATLPTTLSEPGREKRLADLPRDRALRLLHVEDDPELVKVVDLLLQNTLPPGSVIDPVADLNQAHLRLTTGRYDAILLDLSLPDSDGMATVQAVHDHECDTPIIVLFGHEDPDLISEAKRSGAKDVLFKSHLDGGFLDAMLRDAVEGHRASDAALEFSAAPQAASKHAAPRYLSARASIVIPMLADHRPGTPLVASTIELSASGAGLLIEGRRLPEWDRLVLGIERADGGYCHATAMVSQRRMPAAGCHLDVEFVPPNDDPLSDARLAPRFDPATCRLMAGLPEPVLHAWEDLGVVRRYLIDRIRSCPRCSGLPTFRDGCRECGSVRTASVQFIHHFACAHVTAAIDFDRDSRLVCPKCRARNLIVGSDFEYLPGPIRCLDCSWSGTQLSSIAECLKCGLRFLGSEAPEIDVFQFHVERLDPLAFV